MADDLDVSTSRAGLLISGFALGVVIGAPAMKAPRITTGGHHVPQDGDVGAGQAAITASGDSQDDAVDTGPRSALGSGARPQPRVRPLHPGHSPGPRLGTRWGRRQRGTTRGRRLTQRCSGAAEGGLPKSLRQAARASRRPPDRGGGRAVLGRGLPGEDGRGGDMRRETRWPKFARRAADAGAAGMLSFQLWVEGTTSAP